MKKRIQSQQKKSKKIGNKFEDKVAKTIGSGSMWFSPLDLDYKNYCVECKVTDKKGFRISLGLLEKIWNQALDMNKQPYLVIGIKKNENQYFIVKCDISIERRG